MEYLTAHGQAYLATYYGLYISGYGLPVEFYCSAHYVFISKRYRSHIGSGSSLQKVVYPYGRFHQAVFAMDVKMRKKGHKDPSVA